MEIKDVKPNQGNIDLVAEVKTKEQSRSFEKFGKKGKVCNAVLKDKSGEITLTLWNDDADAVKVGDKVHLTNGWCSEYKGAKQLSTGKFGKIVLLEAGAAVAASTTVFTNDPGMLGAQKKMGSDDDDDSGTDDDFQEEVDEEYID